MYTQEELRIASKLYSLLYNGANIYNAPYRSRGYLARGDVIHRYVSIVRELHAFIEEGKG